MGRLGIKQLVHVGDGFTPGERPHPMAAPGIPALLPLICYESLFPRFGDRSGPVAAKWIVNISNDAWFGATSGPWQHLNLASYRAIEEGLPMVRATPTGVSAVVDAYGRTSPNNRLELGRLGVIDATLPVALSKTPFMIIGNLAFWLLNVFSLSLAVRQIVQSVKST
jgi:apolipoprotein N-acyltransferase